MIITLQDLKTYLNITDTSKDDLLNFYVDWINKFIKSYTWRNIEAQDYEETFNGDWTFLYLVKNYPINSIAKIENKEWDTREEINYKWYMEEIGEIYFDTLLIKWINNYKVSYNWWYETIPWDLKLAWLKLAGKLYNKADWIKQESNAGDSITFTSEIDMEIQSILDNYKLYNV